MAKTMAKTCFCHVGLIHGLTVLTLECNVWHFAIEALQSQPTTWPPTFYLKLIIFIHVYS